VRIFSNSSSVNGRIAFRRSAAVTDPAPFDPRRRDITATFSPIKSSSKALARIADRVARIKRTVFLQSRCSTMISVALPLESSCLLLVVR
jgi:hypothetical protein